MKAAVLNAFGEPLTVQTLPDPELGSGAVIVDMAAAGVASYAIGVFSGARRYMLELPIAPGPGGIGRVRAAGPDATKLSAGDWVYVDATIRSRDDVIDPDTILLGWTARTPGAMPLHRLYHHGSFAEQLLVPTENVTAIGQIDSADAGRWCAIGRLLVPFGGLLAGELRAGETLVVSGATGGFGSAGVAVALGMGAGRVVATGRNAAALQNLVRRFGPRVKAAPMSGVEADDRKLITELADGRVDMVLDLLPREASGAQVRAAAMSVRQGGRVILMGGVGSPDLPELELPYRWFTHGDITVRGNWMYPREAVSQMVRLVQAGLIDLDQFDLVEFDLDQVNEALLHAAEGGDPLRHTVLRPDRVGAVT